MQLEHKVNRSAHEVFGFLSDPQKFVTVHPVIYRIDSMEDGQLLIYEKMKMFGIPLKFTYTATITGSEDEKRVDMVAVVKKMTRIKMQFVIEKQADHTLIKESVELSSPLPIRGIMFRIFRKLHPQLFKNIEGT